MAKFVSKIAMDMGGSGPLNFAHLLDNIDARFSNTMIRIWQADGVRDTFKGSFTANSGSQTISGTAKEWSRTKGSDWQFVITQASISAAAVLAAAKTNTLSDDRAVIIKTFSKSDTIVASKFTDKLFGFDGNDTIEGGGAIDRIDGGNGNDLVSFADKSVSVKLILNGATLSYAFEAGIKTDKINNVEGAAGGTGNDTFTGDGLANLLIGNGGRDTLVGGGGNDTLLGGNGHDSLKGGSGRDKLLGEADRDTLVGGGGNDTLDGGTNNDLLLGGGGNDRLGGGPGADYLDGGAGEDSLQGGGGNDVLLGGTENDRLVGASGSDSIRGGAGSDQIDGSSGNDTVEGGAGRDYLTGGADADTFRYLSVLDSPKAATVRDLVMDFVHLADRFDLSAIDARASTSGNQAFKLDAKGASTAAVAEGHIGWYVVNKSGTANDRTYLRINTDSDATIEMSVELNGLIKLSNVDFIL